MSSIFWYQKHEMCGCLKRNNLLSCIIWGKEGPRPAQDFSIFLGRGETTPGPLWLPTSAPGPETPQVLVSATDLHPCWNGFTLKDVTVLFQKEHVSFFLGFFLLNKFPCHLFVFSNCSSFKAPCLCSFCFCIGYFWKLGNQEEGGNLGELTAVEEESSFPWCAPSSLSFLLMTSVSSSRWIAHSRASCSWPSLCPGSSSFPRGAALQVVLASSSLQWLLLLCCFSGSASWPKSG